MEAESLALMVLSTSTHNETKVGVVVSAVAAKAATMAVAGDSNDCQETKLSRREEQETQGNYRLQQICEHCQEQCWQGLAATCYKEKMF